MVVLLAEVRAIVEIQGWSNRLAQGRPIQAPKDVSVAKTGSRIFRSYAGEDAFEASLLQYAIEHCLADLRAVVWTCQRDQAHDEKAIAEGIKRQIREAQALILLVSPATLTFGATRWMELACADALEVPIFVLLSHVSYAELREREKGVPPLLLQSQCNNATRWQDVVDQIRRRLTTRTEPES
jgi:hypothetical protein